MATYNEAIGENAGAFKAIKAAYELDPDNPNMNKLWNHWKDYNEKKDTSAYLKKKRGMLAFLEKWGAQVEKKRKKVGKKRS